MSDSHTAQMMSFFSDCRFQCYKAHPYTLLVRKTKQIDVQKCTIGVNGIMNV